MKNSIKVDLQIAVKNIFYPKKKDFVLWVNSVCNSVCEGADVRGEVCIRIVTSNEIQALNKTYRNKNNATNVLSFNYESYKEEKKSLIGDIAICAEVVNSEAIDKKISPQAHWAHIVIHGVLHLFGYDHENEAQANIMEQKEAAILHSLGFSDPYLC